MPVVIHSNSAENKTDNHRMGADRATEKHLFRCPKGESHLRGKTAGVVKYCDSEVWENPAENLWVDDVERVRGMGVQAA